MALKGTLKDFGIADILQLIGQQQKTGILNLVSKDQEVHIGFKDGNIVRSESTTRKKKDLIGSMLVRAEIISERDLESALEVHKRSLKRLGDVLVEERMISRERFRQMVQLQATETLYKLFTWKNGTYAFVQQDVEIDSASMSPLRAESVLMEGFRMVDEWPMIKKKITSYAMTFEKVRNLPLMPARKDDDEDRAFHSLDNDGEQPPETSGEFKGIGDSERTVFGLVQPGRDVRKIIDLSCLGEFETCKALTNLVSLDFLKAIAPATKTESLEEGNGRGERMRAVLGWGLATVVVFGALGWVGLRINLASITMAPSSTAFTDPAAQRFISRAQVSRIVAALDVYRMEKGEVPERLESLVDAGLLALDDLRYPWRETYYYRRTAAREFILLPPLR